MVSVTGSRTNRRSTAHRQAASPLYYQLAAQLRDRIEAGELLAHAPVPSERRLSEEYKVSRMTARQALTTLEQEGYVYRDGRRGTFVAEPRVELAIGSFSDEVVRRGRRPGARLLSAETIAAPSGLVRDELELSVGEQVHLIRRLRLADSEPLAIETTHLPEALCPDLLDHDLSGSLWAVLREHFGVTVTRAEATIEAVALDHFESERLAVPEGAPGILLTRTTFAQDGTPVEFARDIYRGDGASFRVQASIPSAEATEAELATTRASSFDSPRVTLR